MIIRITGRVEVLDEDEAPLDNEKLLRKFDGAVSQDGCADYLSKHLADLNITGGVVKLTYDKTAKQLRVVTEYECPAKLKPADLKQLTKETLGQWSDGIGEGCFDELSEALDVTVDLSPPEQSDDLRVEQIDDGKKKSKSSIALAKAARDGDTATLRKLLDAGADMEARLQRSTPLHWAVLNGHAEAALELIGRGADLRALDELQSDPLMLCAMSNGISDAVAAQVARALLERGVDVHARRGDPDVSQYTPLYMAKSRKKRQLEKVLREFGAKK